MPHKHFKWIPVNGKHCRIIDTSSWSLIPTPEFNIVPATSNIEMRPHQEKKIPISINTNSVLESNAVLGVNYPNDDNEGEEKKLNINFISNNITISQFRDNSAILSITALEDEFKEPKRIPITISANISFPKTITNRGGDIYYVNNGISMYEYSYLTLTILPFPWYQPIIDTLVSIIDTLVSMGGPVSTIVGLLTIITTIVGVIFRRRWKESKKAH